MVHNFVVHKLVYLFVTAKRYKMLPLMVAKIPTLGNKNSLVREQ